LDAPSQTCRKGSREAIVAATAHSGLRLSTALAVLMLALALVSLMVGPAALSPREALAGLLGGDGTAGIVVRDIRLPRTMLALLIGATFGLAGAALQGL
jgi:iron complex transport system permease protein